MRKRSTQIGGLEVAGLKLEIGFQNGLLLLCAGQFGHFLVLDRLCRLKSYQVFFQCAEIFSVIATYQINLTLTTHEMSVRPAVTHYPFKSFGQSRFNAVSHRKVKSEFMRIGICESYCLRVPHNTD